jgi:hypothetical protein
MDFKCLKFMIIVRNMYSEKLIFAVRLFLDRNLSEKFSAEMKFCKIDPCRNVTPPPSMRKRVMRAYPVASTAKASLS